MNLTQISRIESTSTYAAEALAVVLTNSQVLQKYNEASAFEVDTIEFNYRPADASASAKTRALGGGYSADAVTPNAKQSGSQKFYGDSVTLDNATQADANLGLDNIDTNLQKQMARKLRDFARNVEAAIFNGSGSGNNMRGLKTILDGSTDLPGFTGVKGYVNAKAYSSESSPVSLDLTVAQNKKNFILMLNEVLTQVGNPNAIFLNRKLYGILTQIAYDTRQIVTTLDAIGNQVITFNGVPLVITNDATILNNEPDDTGTPVNNTTSLYIASLQEMRNSIVTNSGFEFTEWDAQPATKQSKGYNWEMRLAHKIEESDAIRRIAKIKV
jgi:hypothetical protein